ncbi:MAG: aldo/keto reductase [Acidobacteria bacterium]|nr:aldo/keto reductase [Acidobacteriota bacterium]
MKRRLLGSSDMEITPIGIGAWAMGGGGWAWSWGPQSDDDSVSAIHAALDCGLNWIDTAAVYGLGHSEEVVARALKGRQRCYIFTKCERVWNEHGEISGALQAESIRRECEASLRRLEVDVIDLYQIHWPEPEQDIEEGWTEMARLQQEGKVRWIGVSNFNLTQLRRAQAIAPVTSLQPPYSILARDIERELLPYCQQANVGVIVYSPMYSGLLSGAMTRERVENFSSDDWRRHDREFEEPNLSCNLHLVERLRSIGKRHGRSAGEVAIAWTLRHPAITAAIVGVRCREQVGGIIGAAEFRLSHSEVVELEQALQEKIAA